MTLLNGHCFYVLCHFYSQDRRVKLIADNGASSPYLILSVGSNR
jgi:hypothetical protein